MKEIARWSREEVDALLHAWREGLTQKPAPLRRGKLNAYVSARFQALRDGHEPFRTACSIVYKKKYWKSMAQFICEYNAAQQGLNDSNGGEVGDWFALSQDERKRCFSELKTTSYKFTDLEQDTVFEIAKLIAIEDGVPDMSRMVYVSSSSSLLRDGSSRSRYASGTVGGTTTGGAGGYSSHPSSADYSSSSNSRPQQSTNEPTYHRAYSPANNNSHSLLPVRSSFVHATTGPMTHLPPTGSNNSFLRSSLPGAALRKRPTVLIDDDDDTMTSSDDDEALEDDEEHANAPSTHFQQPFLQVLSKRASPMPTPMPTPTAASPRDVRELHDKQQHQPLPPASPSPPFTLAGQSRRDATASASAAAEQSATPELMKIVDRLETQAQELKAMVHQEREARKQAREQHDEQQKAWQREQEAHQQVLDLLKSSQQASLEIQRTRQSEHAEWAKVLEQLQLDREERARLAEARRKDQEERLALLEEMKKSQADREQMLAEWKVEREERAKLLEQVQKEKEVREQDEKEWRALLKQMKVDQEASSREKVQVDQKHQPGEKTASKQDRSEKPSAVPTSATKPSDSKKDRGDDQPKKSEAKPVKCVAAAEPEGDVVSTVKEGAEVLRVLRQLAVPPPAVA
ncbi:hypothetical protein Gpo141_00014233, partial [Globisporangium polare]